MATPTVPVYDYSHAEPSLAVYSSMMFQRYLEILDQNSKAEVLDLGPVCEENIIYFAQRLKRLHVCDMFLRLDLNRRKGLTTKKIWEHLDHTPHSLDGINLWDFIDHLNEKEIGSLVKICRTLLKPKGMITITSFEEQWAPEKIYSFIIQGGCKVIFRLQDHLELPRNYYSNRIITDIFSEFPTVNSFIYRNGVREFLCRRD